MDPLNTDPLDPDLIALQKKYSRYFRLSLYGLCIMALLLVCATLYIFAKGVPAPVSKSPPTPTPLPTVKLQSPSPTALARSTIKLFVIDQLKSSGNGCDANSFVEREASASGTILIKDALNLLISDTLTPEEKEKALINPLTNDREKPTARLTLQDFQFIQGVATITLTDPDNLTIGGSCRVESMYSAIEQTVFQFPEVKRVILLPESLFEP